MGEQAILNNKLMDLRTKRIRTLSGKSRYLSAAISPDGKNIAASENTTDNKNNLVFIDAETGNVFISIPSPGNAYLQRPQWSEEAKNCDGNLPYSRGRRDFVIQHS